MQSNQYVLYSKVARRRVTYINPITLMPLIKWSLMILWRQINGDVIALFLFYRPESILEVKRKINGGCESAAALNWTDGSGQKLLSRGKTKYDIT